MKTTPSYSISPKILPWLAHKAGISTRRAEILWRAAERHAAHALGETGTPAYWSAAMDRLLELLAAESLHEETASFGWRAWTRHHTRFWHGALDVLDALSLNVVRGWRLMRPIQFG